jgi:hypothetical protein
VKNIVLYAKNGDNLRPLFSCDADDRMAAIKMQAAASAQYNADTLSGVPQSTLAFIAEEREASADGVVIVKQTFTPLDPLSCEPMADKKPQTDLKKAFALACGGFASVAVLAGVAVAAAIAVFCGFHLPEFAASLGMGALVGRGWTERANVISGNALVVGGTTLFSKEFPMGEGWRAMWLRFNHVFTVGTGTTAITEGELLIIKNVLLRSDRGEIFCNLPGRALYKIATWKMGTPLRKDAIAAASSTYRVTLPIFFADEYMLRPEDTIVDSSRYNSVSLQITYGTVADLLTSVGTSSVAPTLDVELERSFGRLPDAAKPLMHINYDYRPPVDANTTTAIDLERSADLSVKRYFMHSGTSGAAGTPWSGTNSDAVQNVIQIKDQNRFIEKDRVHAQILDETMARQKLAAILSGVEVFDFVLDGSITASLATADKSVLQYTWTNQGGVGANSIVTATQEGVRTLK